MEFASSERERERERERGTSQPLFVTDHASTFSLSHLPSPPSISARHFLIWDFKRGRRAGRAARDRKGFPRLARSWLNSALLALNHITPVPDTGRPANCDTIGTTQKCLNNQSSRKAVFSRCGKITF